MDDYREMLEYLCNRRLKNLKEASRNLIKEVERTLIEGTLCRENMCLICDKMYEALKNLKELVKE